MAAGFLNLTAVYEVRRHLLPCPRVVHSSGPACPVSPPSWYLPGEGIAFRIQILASVSMRSAFVRPSTDHPWRRSLLYIRNDRPWQDPHVTPELIVRENDPRVTSELIVRENDPPVTSELISVRMIPVSSELIRA